MGTDYLAEMREMLGSLFIISAVIIFSISSVILILNLTGKIKKGVYLALVGGPSLAIVAICIGLCFWR